MKLKRFEVTPEACRGIFLLPPDGVIIHSETNTMGNLVVTVYSEEYDRVAEGAQIKLEAIDVQKD